MDAKAIILDRPLTNQRNLCSLFCTLYEFTFRIVNIFIELWIRLPTDVGDPPCSEIFLERTCGHCDGKREQRGKRKDHESRMQAERE